MMKCVTAGREIRTRERKPERVKLGLQIGNFKLMSNNQSNLVARELNFGHPMHVLATKLILVTRTASRFWSLQIILFLQ